IFTDGLGVGAALDRNGLRPLRWARCEDGLVVCCSEAGTVDLAGHGRVWRGRLGPGQMLFVDPVQGLLLDHDCKERMAAGAPYARWASDGLRRLTAGSAVVETPDPTELLRRQATHGYTVEELRMMLKPMANDAHEPIFSMGDDTPLPPLAAWARPVHHYMRQRFAQVTNPPIDHLRERLVMSLRSLLGPRRPLLSEGPQAAELLSFETFLVFPSAVEALSAPDATPWPVTVLDATYPVGAGPLGLRDAVEALAAGASAALSAGPAILVINNGAVSAHRAPIPALLATGAVHHRLIAQGTRFDAGLVVVAHDARDTHGVACLLGFGADLICPQLALETVAAEADAAEDSDMLSADAQERFQAAVEDGVLKILSKMGISTVESYRAAQVFEVIGLGPEIVATCFAGCPSTLGGIGWAALGDDLLRTHASAWRPDAPNDGQDAGQAGPDDGVLELANPGFYRDLKRGGEFHTHNHGVVEALQSTAAAHLLQQAIARGSTDAYHAFARLIEDRPPVEPRDLLELIPAGEPGNPGSPIPLDVVEPASSIVQRFSTGAMSHGSLSAEAHETLAQAMNLLGGRSNCGEGGEDPARFATRGSGRDDKNSRIKQIASGRFGVTPAYCAHADELQIKVAQGSKPGEGGQLPGHKVSDEIARLRHTQPGVTLISPPPHHDVYSIEDLAQLIFDLKQVNRFADVSVKLVATHGVGTIAAGVVKALADVVHISGANGGTGASPLSSIKHCGMPWELGLVETQASLIANGLRDRVRIRVDGGFMTGRDVIVAALLGADEFSFGTAAMIAEGCIMLRACHRDTCTTGVATQRPNLRAKFSGTPEGVAAYLLFVANDARQLLGRLGLRSMDEAIGRVELVRRRESTDPRAGALGVDALLAPPSDESAPRRYVAGQPIQRPRSALGDRLEAELFRPVWEGDEIERSYPISNADRTVGAALGGALALEFGDTTPRGAARIRFDGSAGQSFGAFLTDGVELTLVGEANDYVGKGMGGGRIVIRPPANDASQVRDGDPLGQSRPDPPALAGNTCLYGATNGTLLVAGAVGERFAVRNSGASAVVEGVGDHACEYMTGGTVVILGEVGYNLGAGMTGGHAIVWDPDQRLDGRLNPALVELQVPEEEQLDEARWLIELHAATTGSLRARALLGGWRRAADELRSVEPRNRMRRRSSLHTGVVATA
ncbi:MAG: glutamate synthase large subunit, partial [Acidimicrobiales bacterium]